MLAGVLFGLALIINPAFACPVPDIQGQAAQSLVQNAAARLAIAPRPLPEVHTEGTLPGDRVREASLQARRDLPHMRALAIVWALTGDRRFLDAAARYLDAWARVYRPSYNPL